MAKVTVTRGVQPLPEDHPLRRGAIILFGRPRKPAEKTSEPKPTDASKAEPPPESPPC